jgi:hypothetical protein
MDIQPLHHLVAKNLLALAALMESLLAGPLALAETVLCRPFQTSVDISFGVLGGSLGPLLRKMDARVLHDF